MLKGQAKKDYQGVIPNVAKAREELSKLPQMGTAEHWAAQGKALFKSHYHRKAKIIRASKQ